jgi:excisionase family DNA binding protein
MDVHEVSDYLNLGVTKLYQLIERKAIPASKVGRQYRFLRRAIDAWLMRNMIMKDPEFFRYLITAQRDFVKASYTQEDIENAVKKVRQAKSSRP